MGGRLLFYDPLDVTFSFSFFFFTSTYIVVHNKQGYYKNKTVTYMHRHEITLGYDTAITSNANRGFHAHLSCHAQGNTSIPYTSQATETKQIN